jgi:hypothetical protein
MVGLCDGARTRRTGLRSPHRRNSRSAGNVVSHSRATTLGTDDSVRIPDSGSVPKGTTPLSPHQSENDQRETAHADTPMEGRAFYSPGIIAAYCVVSLPVGLSLYGLNLIRRKSHVMGYALFVSSAAFFALMVATVATGGSVSGFGILGVLAAIWLLKLEEKPYRRARSQGGIRARWWPPLLWLLGGVLVAVVVGALLSSS